MKKYLSFLIVLVGLSPIKTGYCQSADSNLVVNSLIKCWRAFSHEYSPIYGLEEEEIATYSKRRLCFARDSAVMFYGVVYEPTYFIKKVNAENYAKENFDCGKKKLNIYADSVYEITMKSISKSKKGLINKMTDVVLYDGASIFVVADGVIFKMLDADSKVIPSGAH